MTLRPPARSAFGRGPSGTFRPAGDAHAGRGPNAGARTAAPAPGDAHAGRGPNAGAQTAAAGPGSPRAGRGRAGRALPAAGILLVGASLLAGCGAGQTVRVGGDELRVRLSEYRIQPQAVSVPAGRVRIVARNVGLLTHNLQLERGSLDSAERPVLASIHTLLPGASGSVIAGPLAPGTYMLVSSVDDQTTLGMAATLTVR